MAASKGSIVRFIKNLSNHGVIWEDQNTAPIQSQSDLIENLSLLYKKDHLFCEKVASLVITEITKLHFLDADKRSWPVIDDRNFTPIQIRSDLLLSLEILRFCCRSGLNPNASDNQTDRPLSFGLIGYHVPSSTMKILIDAGADINAVDGQGQCLLMHSAHMPDMLRYLLDQGADPAVVDTGGCTPFFYALMSENMKSIDLLWAVSDHSAVDSEGRTAMDVLYEHNEDLCEKLEERYIRESKINLTKELGSTAGVKTSTSKKM